MMDEGDFFSSSLMMIMMMMMGEEADTAINTTTTSLQCRCWGESGGGPHNWPCTLLSPSIASLTFSLKLNVFISYGPILFLTMLFGFLAWMFVFCNQNFLSYMQVQILIYDIGSALSSIYT